MGSGLGPGLEVLGGYLCILGSPNVHPVAPYGYLLPIVYLFMANIAIGCRPEFVSTSPAFMRSSASHPGGSAWPACPKTVNRAPIVGGGRFRHNMHSNL